MPLSSDGSEKLLKASQLFSHADGTNNSLYSSSITDDGKVFVSAEYTDEDGNTDTLEYNWPFNGIAVIRIVQILLQKVY